MKVRCGLEKLKIVCVYGEEAGIIDRRKLMKLCLELKRLARKDMLVCVALTNRLFKKKQPFSCTVAERNSVALLTPDSLLLRFSVLLLRMVHVRISLAKCCLQPRARP
ncbi:Lamin-B receptor [Trichinella pseudospiralis]